MRCDREDRSTNSAARTNTTIPAAIDQSERRIIQRNVANCQKTCGKSGRNSPALPLWESTRTFWCLQASPQDRGGKPSPQGREETLAELYPHPIPAFQTSLTLGSPRPLKGRIMRRREVRTRCGVPAGRFASRRSGRRRAPPGSTTRPRQELADDSPAYPKRFPARRHGPRRIAGQGAAKPGPMTAKSPQWRAARRPPYPANGCGHHRFASFGAPTLLGGMGSAKTRRCDASR